MSLFVSEKRRGTIHELIKQAETSNNKIDLICWKQPRKTISYVILFVKKSSLFVRATVVLISEKENEKLCAQKLHIKSRMPPDSLIFRWSIQTKKVTSRERIEASGDKIVNRLRLPHKHMCSHSPDPTGINSQVLVLIELCPASKSNFTNSVSHSAFMWKKWGLIGCWILHLNATKIYRLKLASSIRFNLECVDIDDRI